jgi:geranylgeranyl diphosphate synthase, type II
MRSAEELRQAVDEYLAELALTPELGGLADSMRYALDPRGKRVRPVLCLATGEALGREPEELLPAAAAVELVHNFSLVHDDLPALDDDDLRRGRATAHVEFGEATAILAGDALLAEAFRLALSYPDPAVARELVTAVLGMIGGQFLDISGDGADLAELHRLKTGRLFAAAIGTALRVAGVPDSEQRPWRDFADDVGLLFQIVDDLLDGDGYAVRLGEDGARRLADETAARAEEQLAELPADTSVLAEVLAGLAARTS